VSAPGGFSHLSDEVIHEGHIITVSRSRFLAPDGTEFLRDVVRHPGAVSVVPLLDSGEVVLVRQYRAALDEMMLEIPAGKRDVAGEPPEETASRELVEEVGLRPGSLRLLARFHNSVGFSDEESFVFLGTDLQEAPTDRQGIEEAYLEVVRIPLADTPAMIAAGTITDAKTVIGLTLALAAGPAGESAGEQG
jgi:8-oxo-dGTP pyrophosphatase MutT (NUDIX family)